MSDKVGLNVGVTMNLGNYESARVDAWAEVTMKEGETAKQAFERVNTQLQIQLEQRAKELMEKYK